MRLGRNEGLEPVGHGRRLHAQQSLRQARNHLAGRRHRRLVLAEEHRTIGFEVIIVAAVEGIEVGRARMVHILAVGGDAGVVPIDHGLVVAAQHVDVSGHVLEMAAVGHQAAQPVGCLERLLGRRRHLHGVDVHVQQAGVGRLSGRLMVPQCLFQHFNDAARVGALRVLARLQVPELPRSAVHHRLRIEHGDVRVARVLGVDLAHGIGIGVVKRGEVDRRHLRTALGDGGDQVLFDGRR